MKVGFASLGCSKNLVDSENIMSMLKQAGHILVEDPRHADAIVINTCGFINPAKEESINTILEMSRYADKIIVTGCLAQRYEKELREEMPEITAVVPIKDYDKLPVILKEVLEQDEEKPYLKQKRLVSGTPWSAYLKISEGCSNHCTFCAIPLIRGEQTSKLVSEVRDEAIYLASLGVRELTLIAQDTTKYGLDSEGKLMLADLLRELEDIDGIHWIRILYMYPDEIDENLLQAMKDSSKVLPYFDIPIQHASNRLLRKMNRRGTKEDVKKLTERIRELFPEAVLRTTVITGFPTETDEDFEELLDFIKEIGWDRLGAFTYSKEEDTPACSMLGEVDEALAQSRKDRLMEVQKEISLQKNLQKVGSVIEVLVEEKEALKPRWRGRSKADAPDEVDGQVIITSGTDLELGTFVPVRITGATQYDLIGIYEG